jgi:putative hydroxymethylpyrimidine transport system substrate-binding protein
MRAAFVLAGVAALLAALSGCGGNEEDATGATERAVAAQEAKPSESPPAPPCTAPSKQLQVTLDGRVGPENAGILMAAARGYFRDVGLRVWFGTPGSPEAPVRYVAEGVDDIGVAQQPQVLLGNEAGESVVAIGSVIPEPTAAMIWLGDSGIEEVADLKGKLIGYPGAPFQKVLLDQVLAGAGLTPDDVLIVSEGYELVPALLHGEIDAIFGGSENIEGAALAARGAAAVVTPVQELGIPPYEELEVIARPECLAKYPAMYRHFMTAVARGTEAAVKDPTGVAAVIDESPESDQVASRREIDAQLRATLPLLSGDARIDLGQAEDLADWMREVGAIGGEPPVAKLFTNEYLMP